MFFSFLFDSFKNHDSSPVRNYFFTGFKNLDGNIYSNIDKISLIEIK